MDSALMISFLGVAILLTLMPGPDILFVVAQSISQNKRAGIATALGLCTGLTVHITASTLGISAIVYQSAVAFSVIKYAGAAYLLVLAWQSFREKATDLTAGNQKVRQYRSLYRKGILMNVLNPKVSLLFVALLPQFVNRSMGHVSWQIFVLGLIFLVQAFLIFALVSLFSEKIRFLLLKNTFIANKMNMIKGSLLGVVGIQIAFMEK